MIEYGLNLVRDYIIDHCHQIYFLDMVTQLMDYDFELKGDYDIVAAMQMCEIGDQDMMGIAAKIPEEEHYEDIGYYTDDRGYKRFGVIPSKIDYSARLFGEQFHTGS